MVPDLPDGETDMENLETSPQTSESSCRGSARCGAGFGRSVVILLIALAAGFVGGYAGKSFAHGQGRLMSEAMDPARVDELVERLVKHVAVEVDATPEQKDKLTDIVKGAARDLAPLRGNMYRVRQQTIDLMSAESVDRAAIEILRAEQLALMDAASKRLTQALADVADVLTVEQRRELAARAQRFGHRFHHD
jgi:Spy/CpxP family protein refolding chaperone